MFLTQTSSKVETSGLDCFRVTTIAQANNPTAMRLEIKIPIFKAYENKFKEKGGDF